MKESLINMVELKYDTTKHSECVGVAETIICHKGKINTDKQSTVNV